ncbi:MAG: hypothetical protein COA49_00815 [Bacteroidetes bacterium]|nr:MAG: hypothetical protein COA49_00815 [Bacteroidota bacterium]
MIKIHKINFVTLLFAVVLSTSVLSQEVERDLIFMPNISIDDTSTLPSLNIQVRGGSPAMGLPFLDDFAWPSFYEESGLDRPELVRWDSSPVRRTNTFAINPPTIGVATLDGLDSGGYPYVFNSIDAHGWADTLTSRKILLGGLTVDDGVTLSFWHEGGGLGNAPDEGSDTLIVEFKSIGAEGDIWTRVWDQVGGVPVDTFTQVVIPISDGIYLHNAFQFRFRNYGTLMGNADLWHIDYVFVSENGITGNPLEELAFQEPAYSLLRSFSSMPWTHYSDNPEFYMHDTLVIVCNNFGSGPNNQENTGISIQLGESLPIAFENQFIQNVSVTQGPFSTEFLADLYNSSGNEASIIFDPALSDSTAEFKVSLWEAEVGYYTNQTYVFDNDSIGFTQVFDNYYAYDDGSAEKAYALEAAGGQLAVRYPLAIPDTLDGLLIHFTPFYDNAEQETFVLKVWSDDAGVPGEQIDTMYLFHSPQYFTDGYDKFAYYPYDHPVSVSGVIHVGFIQQEVDRLNIGLDKNTNANAGNLHYKLGPGSNWAASEIAGSVMIHPVLRAGKENPFTNLNEISVSTSQVISSELYPNPAASVVSFKAYEALSWKLFSMSGSELKQGNISQPGTVTIDTNELPSGVYWVSMISSSSHSTDKFISGKRLVIMPQ